MSGPILSLEDVEVTYDRAILALRGMSLRVDEGAVVALLGANGSGKTTTLKAISEPRSRGARRGDPRTRPLSRHERDRPRIRQTWSPTG